MQASDATRAIEAAASVASRLGLTADDARVLHNSNNLAVRLLPCDVVARVAPVGYERAQFEIDVAQRLATSGSPAAALDPRIPARVHEHDGFVITFWTYYDAATAYRGVSPVDYARALARLHAEMRTLDVATPHFTDRVADALELVENDDRTPALASTDRELLREILHRQAAAIGARGAAEQMLHGEPHPGNVLSTALGLRFIDFETCCRGPVEFDLAHVPEAVSDAYPGADRRLLEECRLLVLAMVSAWRWDAHDDFPNRDRARTQLLSAVRAGPPWPSLEVAMQRTDGEHQGRISAGSPGGVRGAPPRE